MHDSPKCMGMLALLWMQLNCGFSYEFRVIAVNKHGLGLFSPSSAPITMPMCVVAVKCVGCIPPN